MTDQELRWERVSTKHLIQDKWIDFRSRAYRLPDGNVYEPYYSYSRRSYVVVVASDNEGNFICVRQFRYGIEEVTTEFPAGGIERDGDTEYATATSIHAEEALDAARRELLEETGYRSEDWELLMKIPSLATIADNYAYIFRAKNCICEDVQHLDLGEFVRVEKKSAEEIDALIREEKFQQAMHVMAWLYCRQEGKL